VATAPRPEADGDGAGGRNEEAALADGSVIGVKGHKRASTKDSIRRRSCVDRSVWFVFAVAFRAHRLWPMTAGASNMCGRWCGNCLLAAALAIPASCIHSTTVVPARPAVNNVVTPIGHGPTISLRNFPTARSATRPTRSVRIDARKQG